MKAVVLLSGGLDSAVSLWWALKQGWKCQALSFHYGQRHSKEIHQAKTLAQMANVPWSLIEFKLPWSGSSLTDKNKKLPHRPEKLIKKAIPSTYVPGRNTIFLSFAMSMADQIGAEAIVIGANAIDYSGYPDCRGPYLQAFERVARLGSKLGSDKKGSIRIVAPLLHMTKADIVKLGRRLKVPMDKTWSCYKGGSKPCGQCDSCQLREKGFAQAGN